MKKKRPRGMVIKLITEFFESHPNQNFEHGPVVDWVAEQIVKAGYDDPPRDVWRTIRLLHERGKLQQVAVGIYRYNPDDERQTELLEFPESVKQEIFKRDNYRCVLCDRGEEEGVKIHADHKKPKSKGGDNSIYNGQTLCGQHNTLKKNFGQTTAGKKFFIQTYRTAIKTKDKKMIAFCEAVFDLYDEHDYNGHIERPDK